MFHVPRHPMGGSASGPPSRGDPSGLVTPPCDEEVVRYVRPEAIPDVELMIGERSRHLWRVFHETYTVCLVPEEENEAGFFVDWRYRGREMRHGAGGALLMEPGEVHVTRRLSGPADFRVLQVAPAYVERAARELGFAAPPHVAVPFSRAPRLVAAARRLERAVRGDATPLELESRLAAYVAALLEHCGEERRAPGVRRHLAVRRVREHLAARYAEPVTLDDLERAANLSRFHLIRCFAARFGLPPHAYQVQLRLIAARDRIRAGEPLAHVAADTGFADQSHLGRCFKRVCGVTPGEYRAAVVDHLPKRARTF